MAAFKQYAISVILPVLLLSALYCSEKEKRKPAVKTVKLVYSTGSLPSFSQNKNTEYIISATGLFLTAEGFLKGRPAVREKSADYSLHPLVKPQSAADGSALLKSEKAMSRAIRELTEYVSTSEAGGLHFDFEYIDPALSADYGSFLCRIREKSANQQIKVSAAVFPHVGFKKSIAAFHDFRVIAPCVDYAVLMSYDYHSPYTSPGPVSSIPLSEKNIVYALRHFKPQQLLLGLPAYGYAFRAGRRPLILTERKAGIYKKKYKLKRGPSGMLENSSHPVYSFISVGDIVFREKAAGLAEEYELRGTALWRAGFEKNSAHEK